MGLSNFPTAAEGVLPVLVMNSVLSVALLKNMVRSVFQVIGVANMSSPNVEEEEEDPVEFSSSETSRERRISITQFQSLCHNKFYEAKSSNSTSGNNNTLECCVCLCRFEADEEVSELSCKHFFHKGCLEKWFHNKHETCPLCRSVD
ncbi:43kDa postsynaptic protein [Trema orientale]|uniref:43kDa postsynaptic protein n=1 Tax=Trema orientale TaxID=63057 RepID=A0A2P5FMN4_TREOI|nr:43kDa postsynaptic protein [Trema orientale]